MSQLPYIIERCAGLFIRYGVKNLTMDDIAKELAVSKKTLYLFVANKADLVHQVMQGHIKKEIKYFQEVKKSAKNAVEENLLMIAFMSEELQEFNTSVFFDLQKYYPSSYALLNEHREKVVLRHILNNLKEGMKQGWYRADMNSDIVARIYVHALDILIDQKLFPSMRYPFFTLYQEYVRYHLRGILTEKGIKQLEKIERLKHTEI